MAKQSSSAAKGKSAGGSSAKAGGTKARSGGAKAAGGRSASGKASGSTSGGGGTKMSASKASQVLRSGRAKAEEKHEAASTLAKRNPRNQRPAGVPPVSERNNDRPWSKDDLKALKTLVAENTPTRVIGLKLGRTEDSIYGRAKKDGLSLKPANRSPRDRKSTSKK
jgi:hypothetical protein